MEIPKDNCNFAATKEYYMVSIEEVKAFLDQFNIKAQVFGIFFRNDRSKNREALLELDISPLQREVIVKSLQVDLHIVPCCRASIGVSV